MRLRHPVPRYIWKFIGLLAKETYKRDDILQKRRIILRGLLIVATPHHYTSEENVHEVFLDKYRRLGVFYMFVENIT